MEVSDDSSTKENEGTNMFGSKLGPTKRANNNRCTQRRQEFYKTFSMKLIVVKVY